MGSGASAPHLKEYFAEKKKFQDADPAEAMGMALMMGGADADAAMAKEKKWYEEVGKPCLEKSFDHHDKDKSKKLEKAEGEKFFANLIQEEETFMAAMSEAGIRASMQATMQAIDAMTAHLPAGGEVIKKCKADLEKYKTAMEKQVKAAVAAAKKDAEQRRKNYKAQKKDFDEAAFKVMDTNGDGSIVLEEFLTFFDPATEKHDELLVALGFMTEQERQQKLAAGQMMGGPGGEERSVM